MEKKFGFWLADIREKRGFGSQRLLALAADVSNATIARIESGKQEPSPKTLKKLAPHLGVPYEELMAMAGYLSPDQGRTNDPTPPNINTFRTPQEARLIENYRQSDNRGRRIIEDVAEGVNIKDDEAASKS